MANIKYGTFADALVEMFAHKTARLSTWQEDVFITIQFPDANSKMTTEYLYVTSRNGKVPWIPTQVELLADNWEIIQD